MYLTYKFKFYFDTGITQINWVTGKLPEVVSLGVLLHFFGFEVTKKQVLYFVPLTIIIVFLLGLFWKRSGLFDIEQKVNAGKNPVINEMYTAAIKINKGGKQ